MQTDVLSLHIGTVVVTVTSRHGTSCAVLSSSYYCRARFGGLYCIALLYCATFRCVALNCTELHRSAPDDSIPSAVRSLFARNSHFASIVSSFVGIFLGVLPHFAHIFRNVPRILSAFRLHFSRISPPASRSSTSPAFLVLISRASFRISYIFARVSPAFRQRFARSCRFCAVS